MTDKQQQNPKSWSNKTRRLQPPPEYGGNTAKAAAWKAVKYPNARDSFNPDPVTLRDQWRFAIRQYSRWYSHAWGTAILAGISFFALGWFVKGSNPIPSLSRQPPLEDKTPPHPGTNKAATE